MPSANDPIYGQRCLSDSATRKLSPPITEAFPKPALKPITIPKTTRTNH